MGLVTVALLTLPPLALRPVRLACLIHAANVHSEPGSNPSKMSRSPAMARFRDPSSGSRSSPERVEEKTGRTVLPAMGFEPMTARPAALAGDPVSCHPPGHTARGRVPVLASHPDIRSPVDPPDRMSSRPLARRLPSRVLDATNLTFVSLCLADECYRPNCQRIRSQLGFYAPAARRVRSPAGPHLGELPLDAIGRCEVPLSNSSRPSFGHRLRSRGKGQYTGLSAWVKSPGDFFRDLLKVDRDDDTAAGDRRAAKAGIPFNGRTRRPRRSRTSRGSWSRRCSR
jgi:hypothetical protein